MQKFITLTLLLLIAQVFTQTPKCTKVTYGHEGSACVPGNDPSNNLRCKRTLVCVDGKCRNGMYGVQCTKNSECWGNVLDDEGVRCLNGKCIKEKYNGQRCEHGDECHSGHCVNGKCYGKPVGLACDPLKPVECEKGLYCSLTKKACTPQLKLGEACNDVEEKDDREYSAGSNFRVICPGGAKCSGPKGNRFCRPYRIQRFTEPCKANEECTYGATCLNGVCVDSQLSQNRNEHICPGSARNCSRLETCVCQGESEDKGRCILTANGNLNCGLTHYAPLWQECQRQHGCYHEPDLTEAILYDSLAKDTCMNDHCKDVARDWLCCLYGGNHYNDYSPLIDLPYIQCRNNTAAIVFVLLFATFLLAGIIVLTVLGVVYYLRTRKPQDHEIIE